MKADNPGAPEDEGLSHIVLGRGSKVEKILLRDAFQVLGDQFLGKNGRRKENVPTEPEETPKQSAD